MYHNDTNTNNIFNALDELHAFVFSYAYCIIAPHVPLQISELETLIFHTVDNTFKSLNFLSVSCQQPC